MLVLSHPKVKCNKMFRMQYVIRCCTWLFPYVGSAIKFYNCSTRTLYFNRVTFILVVLHLLNFTTYTTINLMNEKKNTLCGFLKINKSIVAVLHLSECVCVTSHEHCIVSRLGKWLFLKPTEIIALLRPQAALAVS